MKHIIKFNFRKHLFTLSTNLLNTICLKSQNIYIRKFKINIKIQYNIIKNIKYLDIMY